LAAGKRQTKSEREMVIEIEREGAEEAEGKLPLWHLQSFD